MWRELIEERPVEKSSEDDEKNIEAWPFPTTESMKRSKLQQEKQDNKNEKV